LKILGFLLLILVLAVAPSFAVVRVDGSSISLEVVPTVIHHVAQLNSGQSYVAGCCVNTEDLNTYETVDAVAVTVSFPSTDPKFFPSDSWIGGGMFLQAQDHKYRNVDYGFYFMLVVDGSGGFFVDLGLHQTREGTLPVQAPTEELIYADAWKVLGINWTTPVTLLALWDQDGLVHYSVSASGQSVDLTSVRVSELPNCDNIMYKFYSGNVILEPFPISRYVNYFQFGVVSPSCIADAHWTVDLEEPKMLKNTGWILVNEAWSIEGDISYLDQDWKWGGTPYAGVDAQYFHHPLNNSYEVTFFYDGHGLTPGSVLWKGASPNLENQTSDHISHLDQWSMMVVKVCLSTETITFASAILLRIRPGKSQKRLPP
jgi:hypothetical protein